MTLPTAAGQTAARSLARRIGRIALRLLGPALLIWVLATNDLGQVWRTLLDTDPWLLLLALVLLVPFLVLKGARWQMILRAWRIPLSLRVATELYSVGIFMGVVTPGQAGDAVKAWYLRRRRVPLATGLASCVVDRLFDLGVSALLAASGLYFFWDVLPGGKTLNVMVVGCLLLAVVLGLAVAGSRRLRGWLFGAVLPRLPRALRDRFGSSNLDLLHLAPRQIVLIFAVTLAGLAWTYGRVYLLFLALDVAMPIGPFIALVAILSIVSAASPGGVGTRDITLIIVLNAVLNVGAERAGALAIAISALLLLLNLENILVGFLFSLRYPLDQMRGDDAPANSPHPAHPANEFAADKPKPAKAG